MEIFKKALKQAILEKAEAVRFEAGQAPSLMSLPSEKPLGALGSLDHQTLFELIDAIIPPNPSSPSVVREGSISIVNFGEVKLLASTMEPIKLLAFIPPQGTLPYLQMKTQLAQQAQKAVAPAAQCSAVSDSFAEKSAAKEEADTDLPPGKPDFSLTQAPQYKAAPVPLAELPNLKEPEPDAQASAIEANFEKLPEPSEAAPSSSLDETSVQFKSTYTRGGSEDSSAADPSFTKAAPSSFALEAKDPIPLTQARSSENATTLYVPQAAPASESPKVASPYFAKADDTQTDDYHFHPSSRLESGTRTEVAFPSSNESGRGPMMMDTAIARIKEETIIHFGPSLPGEVISDTGRKPIDQILELMVKQRASDLHLTMNEPPCLRVDGEIVRFNDERMTEEQMRSYLLPIMPRRNLEEFATSHDTDFAYELRGVARFRVNMFRDRMGVGAVLRQIPDRILSADDLGLSPAIRKLCELQKGLVIVTGPTGSGKSTTLASMIDLINETRSDHILTIEDPIEFVHPQKRCLINQREVHKHTKSFSRALRAALREDPDIILIGELRDLETVEIAIETAETGHLVFGTLHTNTAISTVDRLIDQFSAEQQEQVRVMLAESLKGVIAQTLIKKKGGGRVAAQEILIVDRAISALIREGNTHMIQNQMQTQKTKGNLLLNDALMNLVSKGLIEPKDAFVKAIDKDGLIALLQQKGITLEGLKTAS